MEKLKSAFQLEQFCAVLVVDPQTSSPTPVLAQTPGIKPEQLTECRRLAYLVPSPTSDQMPGAVGLFKGETIDYILAKSQAGPQQTPRFQYVIVPAAVLETLHGNIRVFESFCKTPIPDFKADQNNLPPFALDKQPDIPHTPVKDLEDLIDYCNCDMKLVSKLVAAVIDGINIDVVNAPATLKDQFTFVQAMLLMLPAFFRSMITFSIGGQNATETNAHIRFLSAPAKASDQNNVVFDWAGATLQGEVSENRYSKYIIAQLRLDPSLVLEHTEKLVHISSEELSQDMADNTLARMTQRASLDLAIRTGLPVNHKMVADVLLKEKSLSAEAEATYCTYLLSFTLALDEPEEAGPVLSRFQQHEDIAEAVFERLKAAIEGTQALGVYHLMERWTPQIMDEALREQCYILLGMAALRYTQDLVAVESPYLAEFLGQILDLPYRAELQPIVAKIVEISRLEAYDSRTVRRVMLGLSTKYLSEDEQHDLFHRFSDQAFIQGLQSAPVAELQVMITTELFITQLPEELCLVLRQLGTPDASPMPELLLPASLVYGEDYQPLILARLLELAVATKQPGWVEYGMLHDMLMNNTPEYEARYGELYVEVLKGLTQVYHTMGKDLSMPVPHRKPVQTTPAFLRYLPVIAFTVVVVLVVVMIVMLTAGMPH